jgi:hypothetical protein
MLLGSAKSGTRGTPSSGPRLLFKTGLGYLSGGDTEYSAELLTCLEPWT